MTLPPPTRIEPVTDVLHGVSITDPYRWLEDQTSPLTRAWIEEQRLYARAYLDGIPERERIRTRIREFLAVEGYDSLQKVGNRYYFRKRLSEQEQPCIYMREGAEGEDQLLIDPIQRGTGNHTSIKPLCISPDERLLLYEVKEGGERTGTFELFDVETRNRLSDRLPRGYLRGFSFAANAKSFYYVHEAIDSRRPFYRAAYEHVLGSLFSEDEEIFFAGEDQNIRLILLPGGTRLGFAVYRFLEKCFTDVYLAELDRERSVTALLRGVDCLLGPHLVDDRIFAITDRNAPNRRIVEIPRYTGGEHEWIDIVPEADDPIRRWFLVGDRIAVSYSQHLNQKVCLFTLSGNKIGEIPIRRDENVRMVGGSPSHGDLFLERESFLEPIAISCYEVTSGQETLWSRKQVPFDASRYGHAQIWYTSSDGTRIPMFLVGRQDILAKSDSPTIMTSYGGFGSSMTPQFSVFVAFLIERGCLFALPNIRGGSEFGAEWHIAAKRRKRQTAYDDFLCAAESLIGTGRTDPKRLAIFGGSNSGLLVGAALTQRPDLFRAVVCMVPLLDMLRYHLYDNAHIWKEEFGTADLLEDFETLSRYSPYHRVRDGVKYPAVMLVSGDADRNCNPLHARKMTARLQAASASLNPIFLDYSEFRGHSPVLPLSQRIDALTDRMAFLCDQLQLEV